MPEISKMGYARCDIKKKGDNGQIVPEGWSAPSDISSGKVISFHVNYTWNGNSCVINSVKWYPMIYVTDTSNPSNSGWVRATGSNNTPVAFSNSFFTQSGKITLTLNSSAVTLKTGTGYQTLNAISGDPSRISATTATTEGTYALMNFKYSYLVKYNGTNWVAASATETNTTNYSFIEYFIEIKNIKIPKISKYENNVVFTEGAVNELVDKIKKYPITKIEEVTNANTWNNYTKGKPCLKVTYGDTTKVFNGYIKADGSSQTATTTGFQYVPVGSNIKFKDTSGNDLSATTSTSQATGTFRVSVNNDIFEVPIKGLSGGTGAINFGGSLIPTIDSQVSTEGTVTNSGYNLGSASAQWNVLYTRAAIFGNAFETAQGESSGTDPDKASNVRPYADGTGSLGTSTYRWGYVYGTTGNFTTLIVNGNTINATNLNTAINGPSSDTTATFWRGDRTWSNTLTGQLKLTRTSGDNNTDVPTTSTASLVVSGSGYFGYNLTASKVFNAVFNDYAECRTTIDLTPGHVVIDNDDGSLTCSSKRLQPGAQVISDTYGHLMGQTENATTPIAVAGRVLVYTYQPRENYHAGMAVCSAPDGTVDIMSRAEICKYPDCIIGIVSEIPQYDIWGTDNIKVDGRIWIKVK